MNPPSTAVTASPSKHVMIFASAGSGKTRSLVRRFIRLLAEEFARERTGHLPASRLVALTFTRKAAAQFFDEILECLARAAESDPDARALGVEIDRPGFSAADATRLLRGLIDAMPQLALGTLDGFFARILHAFPFEFGLNGDFHLLSDDLGHAERRRVLQQVFRAGESLTPEQHEFLQAFQLATFGSEERSLLDSPRPVRRRVSQPLARRARAVRMGAGGDDLAAGTAVSRRCR